VKKNFIFRAHATKKQFILNIKEYEKSAYLAVIDCIKNDVKKNIKIIGKIFSE
jgi:hypothetical protein